MLHNYWVLLFKLDNDDNCIKLYTLCPHYDILHTDVTTSWFSQIWYYEYRIFHSDLSWLPISLFMTVFLGVVKTFMHDIWMPHLIYICMLSLTVYILWKGFSCKMLHKENKNSNLSSRFIILPAMYFFLARTNGTRFRALSKYSALVYIKLFIYSIERSSVTSQAGPRPQQHGCLVSIMQIDCVAPITEYNWIFQEDVT